MLGLAGCGEEERPDIAPTWMEAIDPEIYGYCKELCADLECQELAGNGCEHNCSTWLDALDDTCGDSMRAAFDCQRDLSCNELQAYYQKGREHEQCGELIAEQHRACAIEDASPGCDAFCETAIECDKSLATVCNDNCLMNEARLEGKYGAKCRKAADALYECEGKATCGDLRLLQDSGFVPEACRTLAQKVSAECK